MPLRLAVDSPFPQDRRSQRRVAEELAEELARVGVTVIPAPAPGDAAPQSGTPAELTGKSLVATFGSLVVAGLFSTATVAAIARVLVAYLHRQAANRITLEDGERRLEVVGPVGPDQRAALEAFLDRALPTRPEPAPPDR